MNGVKKVRAVICCINHGISDELQREIARYFISLSINLMLQKQSIRSQHVHLVSFICTTRETIPATLNDTPPIQLLLIEAPHIPNSNQLPPFLYTRYPLVVSRVSTQDPAVILASTSQQINNSQILILQPISIAFRLGLRSLQRWE